MDDKFIFYDVDGERFKIRESEMSEFEKDFPTAKINMTVDGENFPVGINERNDFLKDFEGSTVSYTNFDEPEPQNTKPALAATKDDKTTVWESAAKGLGSSLAGYGLDALNIISSNNKYIDPNATNPYRLMQMIKTGKGPEMIETPDYDTMMREQSDPAIKAATEMINLSERWGQEADPTGGKEGFVDLIFKGKIGKALQKGVAVTTQSLPTTISARHPMSLVLNMINMAGRNYAKETLENPDIPKWKRGIWAVGSAAWEQIVEKYVDPFKTGGATAEVTEEFAKELLENGVKEAVENIAKKITKRLTKNVIEKSAGEGAEEVVTSIGQDVIGEGLDLIDGETDYGIRAQWEDYKEKHKDATKGDFALYKAKGIFDSFIGGALSGSYMSGPTQIAYEGANYLANRRTGSVMDSARNFGASKTYGDMYDLDADVTSAKEAIASAFTNQDREQTVSNDFIDGLTADDAFVLSSREELSGEQRRAFRQLAITKATQDGLTQKLDEELEKNVAAIREKAEKMSDNGQIVTGVLNGKSVFIKGGIVNNGSISATKDGTNGPVIVIDSQTGEQTTANSKDITSVNSVNVETYINDAETMLRTGEAQSRELARNTMSVKAKYNSIKPLEGKKLMIDRGNGLIEVKIQQVLPESGEVLVKGKKGDLDGQSNIKIGVGAFYDSIYRDDDGNPIITEGESELDAETPEVEEPTTETIDEPIEITGEEDFRDYSGPMLINGVPTNVSVQSQDDATDSVVYTYTDENGNTQRGTATVREFAEAVQKARPTNTEPAPQPAPAPAPAPADEPIEEPISNGPVVEVPVTPQTIDWDVLFEQDPEGYFAEMQNQFGDKTAKRLNAIIAATQKRLDALNKANPQTDNEILENEEKKEKLEAKIASLNDMVARLTAPVVEEVVEPETPEVPETPAPVAEEPAEPETPVVEEPAPEPEPEPAPAPKPVEQKPVAPNPVADPVSEAQEIEKELRAKLDRVGIPRETKQDWARRAGKRVGDLFATREEYGAYEAIAENLGEYLTFFEGGVEESFAKRSNIESGSPEVSVPLTEKPKESNNGETGESAEGRPSGTDSGRTSDEGDSEGDSGNAQTESKRGNKGKGSKAGEQVDKYPARKGNATQKLLVDTFGFNSVTIPNTRKSTLNAIYDFMMEMSKMLGISPKSIGQGGWLSVGNLRSNAHFAAVHEMRSGSVTGKIADVSLKFKYDALTGIAHEWFHALDYALEYFDSGVRRPTTSEIDRSKFSGRKEVWDAVDNIVKAINESGHPERMKKLVRNISAWSYWLSPKEMCARAFDEYILNKFREAGIQIEGTFDEKNNGNPTPEEMAVIAPAFDNLFKVLKEKEGKTPNTSVLYQIGEIIEEENNARAFATESIRQILKESGIEVVILSDEDVSKMSPLKEPNGIVYGWTDGKKIYLTEAGINPNTPVHEYTHLWAKAMMQKNPRGWKSIKDLLRGTSVWNEVLNDPNYSNIHNNEDLVASEVLSRLSGRDGSAKMEKMAQQMIDEAKGTGRKLEARGLIQNMRDALNKFWNWVGVELFGIEKFESVEQITDRVLWDLMNKTDLGELSEGQVETQIVTDPKVIAELEASPKRTGFRNVVQNEDGTFSSPMAYWLQSTKEGAKSRVETAKFELGKWEEAEEHPELVDDKGKVTLVKPNKSTVANVAYDPYIHNRLEPVNLQFKDAWKREDLVYVETEVAENDLNNGYHADKALLPVGVHSWSNGDVMLSRYDKPVRIMPWNEVADAWVERLNGEGVNFDVVPPALRNLLAERGVEILPPHKGMGKDCNDAYNAWKESVSSENSISLQSNRTNNEQEDNIYNSTKNGERDSASSNRGQQSTDASFPINGGIIRDYKGKTRRRAERTNQRVRESLEKHRDLIKYYYAIYPELSDIFDLLFNDIFYRNSGAINANVDDVISYIDKTYGSVGKDLSDFISSVKIEQLSIREEESSNALKEIGVSNNEIVSYDTIKDLFDSFAPMEYESLLFDRLIKLAEQLDVKIFFTTKRKNHPIDVDGEYDPNNNTIAIDASLLNGLSVTDRVDFANRIIHELLHSVTSKGFMLRDAYNKAAQSGQILPAFKLPQNIIDALDTLESVYDAIHDKPEVYGEYGLKNKKEMIAELSNPSFREKLQDNGLWEKVKKAIAQIIGYVKGTRYTSTLSEIEDAVDKLLTELETGSADYLYSLFINTDSIRGNFVDYARSEDARYRKSKVQNAAVDYLVGDPRLRAIENAVNEEASKLGVTVTYKTRSEMPKGHENDKGYFNTKTGEIVICTENASSIADAIQTILHESVAHKGLRQLMGDRFDEFINRVYNSLDAETKAKVDALATANYNGNTAVAMEEYMASLAETEDFANNSVWEKIKSIFEDIINTILGRNDIKIGDNELRYILRASYNNMVNPKNMDSVRGWAQDQMMREEYKVNEATPEILSRTGITPTEVASESARETYNRVVSEGWQEFQRQFQDAMQPMRIAIEAIQQETGNMPVEDYENFLLMWNQISSRSRVEIDNFARRYYDPIFKQVQEIIDQILESRGENKKDESKRAEVYAEIRQYMFAKHGLERNLYYQANKTRKLRQSEKNKAKAEAQKEYNEKINAINADTTLTDAERELQLRDAKDAFDAALLEIETREVPDMRDYSGLTALFGMDNFKKAEEEAQKVIDEFESKIGKSADKLWEKINKATDKTLRHSYESGLISRQQYNEIKGMFKFYIPLRGFDETTAEDVYSYARFEGNKFNPAVQTAKGRTSLADDPLAIIMNMAESEIAQGNKNRAKQALYNFILNRTITDENGNQRQNSLMQVESVWYIKNTDSDGNDYYTIATPNHAEGETYEEFEAKMNALAAEDKAYKSKKGNVDVGMRFQKPTNANAHYIYLKVNGVEKAIYINGDPKAAEAVNGTRKPEQNAAKEMARSVNRILSSTFTNYSLEFTARNYFRDMIYSHINIGIRESGPEYRKKFRQNWRHNNLGTMMKLLKAYRAGELEGRALTEDEAAFVEFMNAGGQTGYTLINSVENHKKDLERAIKNMQKGLEHGGVKDSAAFKATLGGIELLNESSELVTRFAAFKTSRDMGRSVVKSVSDAKEVTVNFNTKGAQDGKGWMGGIANYLGWSKFFFNASVQGVQNIKAMADANKLRFCGTVGGVMAFGFCMPIITSAIAAILGADDDEEEYWNIPEYDRQNNFCIPVGGGKYVKIPLPIGFREVYALGDMVAAMAFNKRFTRDVEQVGMDMANKIASVVLPINPLESSANGLSFWHTLLYTALPSTLQFAVQNATNIDWKGAPLQKEYTYNENDPQWMKAYSSNPDWMVCLSKWCNEHIGDGDMKGLDWSPEKLDNTLSNLFGGIYTLVKKTGKSFSMIWNEENRNLSNVPLSGVVLGSGIDKDDRFVTDAYYDEKEYYDDRIGFIKRRAAQFGFDLEDVFKYKKGQHQPKMMEIYNSKEFDFMQEWYEGNKRLESLEKEIKKFEKEIAKHADPSEGMLNRLAEMEARLAAERREFVNDILELD